jgi:hypothetical protein
MLFGIYESASFRWAWKIIRGRLEGHFPDWDEDLKGNKDMELMLRIVMSKEEIESLGKKMPFGIPRQAQSIIESKMLKEMNELIFGKRLIDWNYETIGRIARYDFKVPESGKNA